MDVRQAGVRVFCSMCGGELEAGAKFCAHCGRRLPVQVPDVESPSRAAPDLEPLPAGSNVKISFDPSAPVAVPSNFLPLRGLAIALGWLFAATGGAGALVALVYFAEVAALEEFKQSESFVDAERVDDVAEVATTLEGLYYLVLLASAVVFVIWLWRATSNLRSWPNPPLRYGPGWSVGAWFVPIANFIIPKQMLNDAWRGATPAGTAGYQWKDVHVPGFITAWWTLWVVGTIGDRVTTAAMDPSQSIATSQNFLLVAAGSLLVVSGASVFGAISIWRISERQHSAAGTSGRSDPGRHSPSPAMRHSLTTSTRQPLG
jgi:hypothetical protein